MSVIVTISPPTPNGDLHLGHLAGPFLAADVYARLQRFCGEDVVLVSYSDDYQSYVSRKARELGRTIPSVVNENYQEIYRSMQLANIDITHFMASHENPFFLQRVQHYYDCLQHLNAIDTVTDEVPYCKSCDVLGYEGFARTECDVCQAPTDLSQCESCAHAPKQGNATATCILCQQPMENVAISRESLNLSRYQGLVFAAHNQKPYRPQLLDFQRSLQQRDYSQWCIDRPQDVGIPITDQHGKQRLIHTWFSGLAGYEASLTEWASTQEDAAAFDPRDPATRFAFFFGYDCSLSHTLVYPMLSLLDNVDPEKNEYYTNCFLKLNNSDFSTSRGIAVWVKDVLPRFDADLVRYYLCINAPETQVENYVQAEFEVWYQQQKSMQQQWLAAHPRVLPNADQIERFLIDACTAEPSLQKQLETWRSLTQRNGFSMQTLATIMTWLGNQLTVRNPEDATDYCWFLLYAAVATPVMPTLSERVFAAHPGIYQRFQSALHQVKPLVQTAALTG